MFKPAGQANFPQMEQDTLAFWEQNNTFEKSKKNRKGAPEFIFYDGPPFATGLPHYGHLLAGTIKDVVPRYQTMRGKFCERGFGWDCHGLPVEYEMEKMLNLSGKREIETYGIDKFNEACRGIVLRYTKEWEQIVKRMGRWVDFKNGYRTMDGAELRDTFGYKASTSGFDAWCTAFHNRKYDSGFAREMSRSVAEYLEQYK